MTVTESKLSAQVNLKKEILAVSKTLNGLVHVTTTQPYINQAISVVSGETDRHSERTVQHLVLYTRQRIENYVKL